MPFPHSMRRLAALFCVPLLLSLAAAATAQTPKPMRSDVGPDSGSSISTRRSSALSSRRVRRSRNDVALVSAACFS